jgi:thiol-disulfide isomerase/thioredoxin
MKKILLLMAVLLTTAAAQAQLWWGYFAESDFDINKTTIGTGSVIPFMVGIYITENHEQLGNSTVKAVRVYIDDGIAATISDMQIWISSSLPKSIDDADYVQDIDATLKDGANEFELDKPYEVDNGAFYIGYYFKSSNKYPVCCGGEDAPNAFLISSPGNMNWDDLYGLGFGKLAFQMLVEGAVVGTDNVNVSDFARRVATPEQTIDVPVKIINGGANEVTSFSYTVTANGTTSEETTVSIPATPFNGSRVINLPITTVSEEGEFTYTITVTKVNGNPNTSESPSATGNIVTIADLKTFSRNVLIEEFTTEYCGYCPEAASGLSSFMTSNPDMAEHVAVVCHHAGYYTDWLTIEPSERYTWFYGGSGTYAPAFMYDRFAWDGMTPVVGRGYYKDYVSTRMEETSYANINLTANFNADKSAIIVTADCERGWNFCNTPARITLFLTEDNIKAKKQSGAIGSFTHQHVLRSVNDTWGEVLDWSDNTATYTYVFNLDESWKTDDLKVVAIISGYDSEDLTNCTVENAAVVVPGTDTTTTGIDSAVDNVHETGRFSLDARQLSAPQRGLNIVRMNDGSVKKVIVGLNK